MNRIHRLVFNRVPGQVQATSEPADGRVSSAASPTRSRLRRGSGLSLLALAISAWLPGGELHAQTAPPATALPTGVTVTSGSANMGTGGSAGSPVLTVTQVSQKVILDWSSFDIGANASVQFVQPGTTAIALNRVAGVDPSRIYGSLSSNGRVFLLNPNGMIFGPAASVNVGSLLASTLDISNADFLADNYNFTARPGTRGAIYNYGGLNASGSVALLGGHVTNAGFINAMGGRIEVAAADGATLEFATDEQAHLTLTRSLQDRVASETSAVQNIGTIFANGGTIVLQASADPGLFATAINHSGFLIADAIGNEAGTVSLVARGGDIVSTGGISANAGQLQITGDGNLVQSTYGYAVDRMTLALEGDATLQGNNAVARIDGHVGGALDLTNAARLSQTAALTVAGNTSIDNGSHDIQLTQAGNDFGGSVGLTGRNVSITAGGDLMLDAIQASSLWATADGISLNRNVTTTGMQRYAGAVRLLRDIALSSTLGDIQFGSTVDGSWSLAVSSPGWTRFEGAVGGVSALTSLVTDSAGATSIGGNITTLGGMNFGDAVQLQNDVVLRSAAGGAISFQNNIDGAHDLDIATPGLVSVAGAIGMQEALDNLRIDAGALDVGAVNVRRDLNLASAGAILQRDAFFVGGNSHFSANGDLVLNNIGNHFLGEVSLDGGNATLASAFALRLGASNLGGDLTVVAMGGLTQGGALDVDGAASFTGNGDITLDHAGNRFVGDVTASGQDVRLRSAGNLRLASANAQALRVQSGGDLSLLGSVRASNLDIAVGGVFRNLSGANAVTAFGGGRWHIYLQNPFAAHDYGGLDSGNTAIWNTAAFGATGATGNRYLFAYRPTLTFASIDATKVYGQIANLGGYTVSGLMNGVAGAYRADSLAGVVSGTAALSSSGANAGATVGGGPYAIDISQGTLDASGSGYALAFDGRGLLSVTPASLTITASDAHKIYGQAASLTGYAVAGLVNGDTVSTLDLASGGAASTATVGDYAITAGNAGGSGLSNYDITYVDGTLSVGRASLVITAGDFGKTYGQNANLSGYATRGLVNGDTVSTLDLASGGAASTATVGDYAITAGNAGGSGLSNYDITYVDGTLSVGRASLVITAGDVSKWLGRAVSLVDYRASGLVNGDQVSGVHLDSAGSGANAPFGRYPITVADAQGRGLENYDIHYVPGTLTVGGLDARLVDTLSGDIRSLSPDHAAPAADASMNPVRPASSGEGELRLPPHCMARDALQDCLTLLSP